MNPTRLIYSIPVTFFITCILFSSKNLIFFYTNSKMVFFICTVKNICTFFTFIPITLGLYNYLLILSKSSLVMFLSKSIIAAVSPLFVHFTIISITFITPSCKYLSTSWNYLVLSNVFIISIIITFMLSLG